MFKTTNEKGNFGTSRALASLSTCLRGPSAVDSDDVSCTDQLDFDEVLGRGAVDDRHERVRLCRPEADRQSVDVRIRPLGVVERELD